MVRLTDRPDMTLDVYRGRKTTMQQLIHIVIKFHHNISKVYIILGYTLVGWLVVLDLTAL